jgi:hypothetical protein
MFLLESVSRAIHADRVREIERDLRIRQLLRESVDATRPSASTAVTVQHIASPSRPARGDSAGQPA